MQMEQLQIYSGFNYEMKRIRGENGFLCTFLQFSKEKREKSWKKKIPQQVCLIKEQEISI